LLFKERKFMKGSRPLWTLFLLFIAISYSISACQGWIQENNYLILQVSTDKKRYSIGEPILITLELFNPTNEAITLTFRSSKLFDGAVWIFSEDYEFFEKIYDAADLVFIPVITVVEIQPYSSLEILSLNYSSSSLEAGGYVIKAISADMQSETTVEIYTYTLPEFSHVSLLLMLISFTFFAVSLSRQRKK